MQPREWDVFASHASEDKDAVAEALVQALVNARLRVWYDRIELRLGDSLREKIDEGLAHSRFGIVILSPSFFAKHWPKQELNGLAQREMDGKKVVLPLWYNMWVADLAGSRGCFGGGIRVFKCGLVCWPAEDFLRFGPSGSQVVEPRKRIIDRQLAELAEGGLRCQFPRFRLTHGCANSWGWEGRY
jgi:hypothetical protein